MKLTPERRMRIQATLVVVWSVLTVLTTVLAYWYPGHPALMAWLIFISCYAIVATHWSGFEGAAPSARE